jgi:all-trans-retinol 13,14-reductase
MHTPNTEKKFTSWDAIVIGGGIGGLSTAAFLATNGKKTLLLEQYNVVGGCSHVFRRKRKWEFDVGIHYIGDCGENGELTTMLGSLGLKDRIHFSLMDATGYDTVVTPNHRVKIPYGWDNYLNNLIVAFPNEEKGLKRFIHIISNIGMAIDRSRTPSSLWETTKFGFKAGTSAAWAMMPVSKLLDYCGLSVEARTVVSVQFGQYGCIPSKAPVVLHAGLLQNYISGGAWYPLGGGQVLAGNLVEVIESHGGMVRTQAKVDKILIRNNKVHGVVLENGDELLSNTVISAADIKKTYLNMVGVDNLPSKFVRKVRNYKMSDPFVNVYLGLDTDLRDWMPNTNYFSVPTNEPLEQTAAILGEEGQKRLTTAQWIKKARHSLPAFIHSSTVKDPDNRRHAPLGHSTLESMSMVPASREFWTKAHADQNYSKDNHYLDLKESLTEIMIQRAEEILPGIKQHIVWKEASTPLSHERFTLATDATAYGLECNIRQYGPFRPKSKTLISGLYLAGTSTAWGPSIEGAFLSGLHAASAILGRDMDKEIHSGQVYAKVNLLPVQDSHWDPLKVSTQLNHKAEKKILENYA